MRFLPILMVAGLLMSCSHQPVSQERKISKEEELAPERAPQQVRDDDDNDTNPTNVTVYTEEDLSAREKDLEKRAEDLRANGVLIARKSAESGYEDTHTLCSIYLTKSDTYQKVFEVQTFDEKNRSKLNIFAKKSNTRPYQVISMGLASDGERIRNYVLELPFIDKLEPSDIKKTVGSSRKISNGEDTQELKDHKVPYVVYSRNVQLQSSGKTSESAVSLDPKKKRMLMFFSLKDGKSWALNRPATEPLVKLLDEECR